jgi:hypothetical protein
VNEGKKKEGEMTEAFDKIWKRRQKEENKSEEKVFVLYTHSQREDEPKGKRWRGR